MVLQGQLLFSVCVCVYAFMYLYMHVCIFKLCVCVCVCVCVSVITRVIFPLLDIIPDVYIVPVGISYDRLMDGNFCREQMVRL